MTREVKKPRKEREIKLGVVGQGCEGRGCIGYCMCGVVPICVYVGFLSVLGVYWGYMGECGGVGCSI